MAVKSRSNRYFIITPADNGDIAEIGPAGTPSSTAVLSVQFDPSIDFVGSFVVLAKTMGQAAGSANAPFLPVPYRRVNVAGVASDRILVADPIRAVGKIEVPSNGDSIALLVECTQGTCPIYSWDLQGSSL